jgi:hypothetical protein
MLPPGALLAAAGFGALVELAKLVKIVRRGHELKNPQTECRKARTGANGGILAKVPELSTVFTIFPKY